MTDRLCGTYTDKHNNLQLLYCAQSNDSTVNKNQAIATSSNGLESLRQQISALEKASDTAHLAAKVSDTYGYKGFFAKVLNISKGTLNLLSKAAGAASGITDVLQAYTDPKDPSKRREEILAATAKSMLQTTIGSAVGAGAGMLAANMAGAGVVALGAPIFACGAAALGTGYLVGKAADYVMPSVIESLKDAPASIASGLKWLIGRE